MNSAKTYATQLANDLTKITMTEFFNNIHSRFYPNQDISFIEYFLELTEHDGEFVVHHSKLFEYGIMTSTESSKVNEKIKSLGLIQDIDYTLADIRERGKSGSQTHKHYHFTPKAFKKCLMRARRYSNQSVDPVIYIDYYLLLEDVFKLYTDYEKLYAKKIDARKNIFIDLKSSAIYRNEYKISSLEQKIDNQSAKIDKLLEYGERLHGELAEVNDNVLDISHQFGQAYDVLDDIHDDLVFTKKTVKKVAQHLEEKSLVSTSNPKEETLHHHALNMVKKIGKTYTINNVAGQSGYVDNRQAELEKDGYKPLFEGKIYQANPIDFRRNIQAAVNEEIDRALKPVNDPILLARKELEQEINEYNLMLQEDIPSWNKRLEERVRIANLTATGRDRIRLAINGKRYAGKYNKTFEYIRFYENERRNYSIEVRKSKYKLKTLPIQVCSTYITWSPNTFVSFEKIKQLIRQVNDNTQGSPYQSDNE